MSLEMDVQKMKYVLNNVYIVLAVAVLVFAVAGSRLNGQSSHAAEAAARRPHARYATGPTVVEAIMALDGRPDLALDWESD